MLEKGCLQVLFLSKYEYTCQIHTIINVYLKRVSKVSIMWCSSIVMSFAELT